LQELFLSIGIPESKISIDDKVIVDTRSFNPQVDPFPISEYSGTKLTGCPIINYIGKINYYWQSKGLLELVEAVKDIKEDFLLLFVSNGRGLNEFKLLLETKGFLKRWLKLEEKPMKPQKQLITLMNSLTIL